MLRVTDSFFSVQHAFEGCFSGIQRRPFFRRVLSMNDPLTLKGPEAGLPFRR
jgi:hypothetical protein